MALRINYFLFALCIVFCYSCKDSISTSLPEYEINLSVEVGHNEVVIELSSVGNINISDIELAVNDSLLSSRFWGRNKIIWGRFNPDDQLFTDNNSIELQYQGVTQNFTFDLDRISISQLDTSAADSVIEGRIYREPHTDFKLPWLNNNSPDFNIVILGYREYDRDNREYIFYHKQFVTSETFVTIPADFNPNASLELYLWSCWGPEPTHQGYSKDDPLPVNFRRCSNLFTQI